MNCWNCLVIALGLIILIGTASADTYTVSLNGSGADYNLSEAQEYAKNNPGEEITFLMQSGDYGEFKDETPERTAWVTWKAGQEQTPIFSSMRIGRWDGPFEKYLQFDGITIQATIPLEAGGVIANVISAKHVKFIDSTIIGAGYEQFDKSKGLYILRSEDIEVKGCKFYGSGSGYFNSVDFAIYGRNSNNVTIDGCDISETGTAIVAWGRNWHIKNNEVHDTISDGVLGASLADSIIEDNNIHDIIKPPESIAHTDCIQLFSSGGIYPGHEEYVYTENIIIRRNIMYNSSGQIMLWNGFIPLVEGGPGSRDIVVEDNFMYNAGAAEFHVDDTENLRVVNNTIIGHLVYRSKIKDAHVENNIVSLMGFYIDEGATVAYENYNIVNKWGAHNPDHVPGSHTITVDKEDEFNALFVDFEAEDFRLNQGMLIGEPPNTSDPCFMSSEGNYVGSLPCIGCESGDPIAIFNVSKTNGYEPLEIEFDAAFSLSCDSSINSYEWDFGDGVKAQGQTAAHTYAAGSYSPSLTVKNSLGNVHTSQKQITVLPSAVPNLVLHLNFDGSVFDFSGKNNHGEWQVSESYGEGIIGQGASMDGTADGAYVLVKHDETLDGINQLTISAWAKKNNAEIGGDVVSKHLSYHFSVQPDSVYAYLFNELDEKLDLIAINESVQDGEWHHYALTYDSNTAKMYLDSQEIASEEFSGTIAENPTRDVYIGKNPWKNSIDGLIDEVRVYDRALTSEEILDLYNQPNQECITTQALLEHIGKWEQGQISMVSLLEKIASWKTGC